MQKIDDMLFDIIDIPDHRPPARPPALYWRYARAMYAKRSTMYKRKSHKKPACTPLFHLSTSKDRIIVVVVVAVRPSGVQVGG